MLTALLWGGSFAAGILWQWRSPRTAEPWNKRIFNFYFHFFAPVVVLFAYTVVPADATAGVADVGACGGAGSAAAACVASCTCSSAAPPHSASISL